MISTQAIRDTITAVFQDGGKDDAKGLASFNTDKGSILMETRIFNESPLQPERCIDCLVKIVDLLSTRGEDLTEQEESDLFFGITKLFQSNNDKLKRMIYLAIKTLKIHKEEAFIVTSCITKDINSASDKHRANALRTLSKIVDPSVASQIERFLKAAIVDKSPFVASSAIVCAMRFLQSSPEIVRRWVNEVTESVRSKHPMVQFHALALLYELKKNDRLALHRVVSSLTSGPLKSVFAECLLVRYATQILKSERDSAVEKALTEYLSSRLHHRSELVVLEAARAVCELAIYSDEKDQLCSVGSGVTSNLVCLVAMQVLLSSPRSVVRFAAVRTLNMLTKTRAQAVAQCNVEVEALLSDPNRCIATLALTILLKTAHESGVERLIKQISLLMSDIPDAFRLEVIKAARQLATTYPAKHQCTLEFLASQLREEGSLDVKKELVEAVAQLMNAAPQTLETGLLQLCEFIEDCEYSSLCIRVLSLIGQLAPLTTSPSKYIRFIYNRLILENASVRAAAIDSLTRIGFKCPQLRRDVVLLLENCLLDSDDEIRDRTCLSYKALTTALPRDDKVENDVGDQSSTTAGEEETSLEELLSSEPPAAIDAIIEAATEWLTKQEGEFKISDLPSEEEFQRELAAQQKVTATAVVDTAASATAAATKVSQTSKSSSASQEGGEGAREPALSRELFKGEENEAFGTDLTRFKLAQQITDVESHSSHPIPLSEKEAEYNVMATKHFYGTTSLIVQFSITNTMSDQSLHKVQVELAPQGEAATYWEIVKSSEIDDLNFDSPRSAFVYLRRLNLEEHGPIPPTCSVLGCMMRFIVREAEDEFGYDDTYILEALSLSITDFLIPRVLRTGHFGPQWESIAANNETVSSFVLGHRTLSKAIEEFKQALNLAVCEETPFTQDATTHLLLLAGSLPVNGSESPMLVMVRANLAVSVKHGCIVKAACRASNEVVRERILETLLS